MPSVGHRGTDRHSFCNLAPTTLSRRTRGARRPGNGPDQTPAREWCPPRVRDVPGRRQGRRGSRGFGYLQRHFSELVSRTVSADRQRSPASAVSIQAPARIGGRGRTRAPRPLCSDRGGLVASKDAPDQAKSRPRKGLRGRLFLCAARRRSVGQDSDPVKRRQDRSPVPQTVPPLPGLESSANLPYAGRKVATFFSFGSRPSC
jgi:hypothetical protein